MNLRGEVDMWYITRDRLATFYFTGSLNWPNISNFLSYGRKTDPSKLLTRISLRQSGFREKSIFLKSL